MVLFTTLSLTAILLLLPSNTLGFSAVAPPRIKDTKVSVEGKSIATVVSPPSSFQSLSGEDLDGSNNNDDDVTLSNYMRLPVEQYVLIEMPLGSSLTKLDNKNNNINATASSLDNGEEFELVVPEITFFNLTLQPVVLCTVQPLEDKVVIVSDQCFLRGSSFIEKTRMNERFDFSVRCTLTWYDEQTLVTVKDKEQSAEDESDSKNKFRFRNREDTASNDDDETNCNSSSSSITVTTSIDVDVDVPRPFSSIPKFVIERTGNAAMKLSLKYIQANFARNLAQDYEKWATDGEYRRYRASLSSKKEKEEVQYVVRNQSLV